MCWVQLNLYYLEDSLIKLSDKFGNISSNKEDISILKEMLLGTRDKINPVFLVSLWCSMRGNQSDWQACFLHLDIHFMSCIQSKRRGIDLLASSFVFAGTHHVWIWVPLQGGEVADRSLFCFCKRRTISSGKHYRFRSLRSSPLSHDTGRSNNRWYVCLFMLHSRKKVYVCRHSLFSAQLYFHTFHTQHVYFHAVLRPNAYFDVSTTGRHTNLISDLCFFSSGHITSYISRNTTQLAPLFLNKTC